MSQIQPLWTPSRPRVESSRMYAFMLRMARKYGFDPDWESLRHWSIAHRDRFWPEVLALADVRPTAPARAVREGEGMLGTRWFPGMELNFAAHLLRFRDHRVALEAEDELGRTRSMTYDELYRTVAGLASGLQMLGVSRGDRVAGYVPNVPEAVVAMLAAASLGAVWSSCSPDFGVNGVLDRFGQIAPKVLIAADGYSYNGKPIGLTERIAAIVDGIPALEHVVVFPFLTEQPELRNIPRALAWHEATPPVEDVVFESLPFDHPLYIMYSSGTTGVPKCIVHGAGGTLLQHMKELILHCDLHREDTLFYFTTCGWMMWNWLVSGLGVGARVALYEGSPGYPDIHHLWQFARRIGITVLGTSPKFLTACENAGIHPGREHGLHALRTLLSTGSPLTVENFRWVYENVKADLQLSSISGGTDIISCFMLGNPLLPVYPGEIQCRGLGMDVHAFNDRAEPVVGEKGELVCTSPFPSQPVGFWNDPDGRKYRSAYFEDFPGTWRHGDFVEITPRGGVIVYGRSDATLNPGGVRIGTAEIYRQVESFAEVLDSIVVGRETSDADVEICLFMVLREGIVLDAALEKRIRTRIAEGATPRHVPRHIRQVQAIPYTISGKKVELAVQNVLHGRPVKNRDALANPEALEEYAGIFPLNP